MRCQKQSLGIFWLGFLLAEMFFYFWEKILDNFFFWHEQELPGGTYKSPETKKVFNRKSKTLVNSGWVIRIRTLIDGVRVKPWKQEENQKRVRCV
jgi:hypothetical protein